MAKAEIRKPEEAVSEGRRLLALALLDTMHEAKLNLDQFAHRLKKDPRSVARMFTGEDKPQVEPVLDDQELRVIFLVALADRIRSRAIEVTTVISVRRLA